MLALIYLGLAICVGERLCGRFYRFASGAHRWASGALVGLVLSSCFTYLVARHFASASNPLLWGDILFFGVAAIFLLNCPPRREPLVMEPRVAGSQTWTWITLGLYAVLASWMMFATLDFKEGTLLIGITQWSDYGPNTAIVQSFAHGHNFPAEYPHYAGEPIRYHFLFYFLAGNLEFLGLNLVWSLNLLSVLTLVCMLALVITLGELLFKSRAVGCLASALFFLHGNLNFIAFLRSQTSFKGALLAIYHLREYLSSHYPYRGEDWGIWTQVVFINQRHLATSIGIFLVVLIFLFDRYLERAKQKQIDRAMVKLNVVSAGLVSLWRRWRSRPRKRTLRSAEASPSPLPAVDETPVMGNLPTPSQDGVPATAAAAVDNEWPGILQSAEQLSPEPKISLTDEAPPSHVDEPLEDLSPAANQASSAGTPASGTVVNEEVSPEQAVTSTSEAERSDTVPSLEELTRAENDASAREASTFATRAYDAYMGLEPDHGSASEAQESEALEFARQSPQRQDTDPTVALDESGAAPFPEQSALETGSEVPPPAPTESRGIFAQLIHDNLVSGRSFLFSGLLLGALPYWNAPVFTAAFAVLLFFFVLFPCRRFMLGLAVATAIVALPQILALRSGNARAGASLIHWGYTLGNVPVMQVVKYLGFTFGVKWLLILIALIFGSWLHWRLFIAIFSLFLLTFCFQFSEEALANHKFLNIWLVLANLFVAYGLWRLWRLRIRGWAIFFRIIAVSLAAPIVVGGVIDFFPIHNGGFVYTGYTNDRLIGWLQAETKPDAIFLTDKFVNHPILLAGRRIWFGYTYFTWSAGYDLGKRETAYKLMYESTNAHQVFTLLKANGIDYVAFDNSARGPKSNEQQVYAPNFKKVFEGSDYWSLTIYKVPENADFVPASSTAAGGNVAPTGTSVFEGGNGKENGQSNFPRGLAVDHAGNILVADTNNGRIQKFSPSGAFLSVIGKAGKGPGEFSEPGGMAVDSNGNIYVADFANNRVQKLKADGSFLAEWKGPDPGFFGPRDVSLGPDNSIYVVDQGHAQIVKLDSNGKAVVAWGMRGADDGQFAEATSVAVDEKNGRVYVADPRNQRIEVFDTDGKFIAKWLVADWGAATGWYFQDLAIDPEAGRLYASSVATNQVLVFDLKGKKIAALMPKPPDKLEGASCLALVKGKLYVLNTYASRVSQIELETK